MSVGETPQRANDSHASLPTAWQTTSLTGPKPAQGAITGANAKTNIYPGKWFSGERLLMQTQELHSGSRRCCSPLPWHLLELMITLVYCVLKSRDWPPFFVIMQEGSGVPVNDRLSLKHVCTQIVWKCYLTASLTRAWPVWNWAPWFSILQESQPLFALCVLIVFFYNMLSVIHFIHFSQLFSLLPLCEW